jgi:hypothetical protein
LTAAAVSGMAKWYSTRIRVVSEAVFTFTSIFAVANENCPGTVIRCSFSVRAINNFKLGLAQQSRGVPKEAGI